MKGRYESFVVRVWVSGRRLLRGEVTHVASGDAARFTELSDVADFIKQQVAGHAGEPAATAKDGSGNAETNGAVSGHADERRSAES